MHGDGEIWITFQVETFSNLHSHNKAIFKYQEAELVMYARKKWNIDSLALSFPTPTHIHSTFSKYCIL